MDELRYGRVEIFQYFLFLLLRRTVSVISIEPSLVEWYVRFKTVPLKALCDKEGKTYLCFCEFSRVTMFNRVCPSLNGGSLEITVTFLCLLCTF